MATIQAQPRVLLDDMPDELLIRFMTDASPDPSDNSMQTLLYFFSLNKAFRRIVVTTSAITRQTLASRGRRLLTEEDGKAALKISTAWHWPVLGTNTIDWLPRLVLKDFVRLSKTTCKIGPNGLKIGHMVIRGDDPIFTSVKYITTYICRILTPLARNVVSLEIIDFKGKTLDSILGLFPKLFNLTITKCHNLIKLPTLSAVRQVSIHTCRSIQIRDLVSALPLLERFTLCGFTKKQMRASDVVYFMDTTPHLTVMFLGASTLDKLPMFTGVASALRVLVVFDMPNLNTSPRLCFFPSVTYFQVRNCPLIRSVSAGVASKLAELAVVQCPNFATLHSMTSQWKTMKITICAPHSIPPAQKLAVNTASGRESVH
jgi:hypothetical protein